MASERQFRRALDIIGQLQHSHASLLQVAKSVVYVSEHRGSNAQFVLRGLVDDARAAIEQADLVEQDLHGTSAS